MSTKIEYVTDTWNPVTGCTPISEGCINCYAKGFAKRLAGRSGYPKNKPFEITFHPDRLIKPHIWRKPRRILVCSMSDLFHPSVKYEWQQQIFDVIHSNPARKNPAG